MQYRKVLALLLFSTCEGTKEKYFIEITAKDLKTLLIIDMLDLKLGYSEKATKFGKIFHLKFDATQCRQILSGRFYQILWPSQNIRTL